MATGDVLTIPASGNAEFRAPNIQEVRVPVTFADFVDVAGVGLALTDYIIPEGSILVAHPGVLVTTPFNDSGGAAIDFVVGVDALITNTIADAAADGTPPEPYMGGLLPLTSGPYLVVGESPVPFFVPADTPVSFVMGFFGDDGTTGEAVGFLFLIAPETP